MTLGIELAFYMLMIRYGFFSVLLLIATFLAYEAGLSGVKNTGSTSERPFRSFPFFNQPNLDSIISDVNDPLKKATSKKQDPQKKEDSEKNKDDSKQKSDQESSVNPETELAKDSRSQNDVQTDSENGVSRETDSHSPRDTFSVVHIPENAGEKHARQKVMPQFSQVYVPVYDTDQLKEEAWVGFTNSFPNQSPQGKVFVMDRKISSHDGISYEIQVYEKDGFKHVGAFSTLTSERFPFAGIPVFTSVKKSQFDKNSRYLIFSNEDIDVRQLLSEENEVSALIQTAYEPNLDSQMYLGRQNNELDVYKIFPGIFAAQALR